MTGKATAEAGVYGQLMREVFTTAHGLPSDDVRALTVDAAGRVWAATRSGVARYELGATGGKWRAWGAKHGLVDALALGDLDLIAIAAVGRSIYVASVPRLYRLAANRFEQVAGAPKGPYTALRASHGKLLVAGEERVGIWDGKRWQRIKYPQPLSVTDLLADDAGDLWLAAGRREDAAPTTGGLWRWDGKSWTGYAAGRSHADPAAAAISCLENDGAGTLWVGTSDGIGLCDPGGWFEAIKGADGLPYERVSRIACAADGTVWAGFPIGCARLREGEWDYFGGGRWLPDDEVRAIAVGSDGAAWVATGNGISRIYEQPMTLARKAAHFEDRIQQRHYRMGYVADCSLDGTPGDVSRFTYEASDNDGLWTALYVAAESFRYAVTGEEQARALARTSVYAMMELERLTPIPGFPARAIVRKGEPNVRKSGGEWHDTEDGLWEWKGDTSSDEIDGHFYAYALYYDLVADRAEKEDMRGICRRIMDHIIDHGYYLVDLDGKHTMWGVWAPEMLNGPWEAQRGLNSLELLSYLKTTYHVTGDEKYQQHYLTLAHDHHYALNTLYQKITYPGHVNHSDDELAIIAYEPLLRYETDPALRAIYAASLERTWRIERPEHSPFQNYIYGAVTGKFCDVEESLAELRDIPWETVQWGMRNSHRADLAEDVRMGRFSERQATTAIKAHERGMLRWNGNPYRLDGGGNGRGEDDGAFFLLPYWMGRYYGFIKE